MNSSSRNGPEVTSSEAVDFIVVGAGTAGCVVAARLSESGKYRVALIEAGTDRTSIWVNMPLGFGKLYNLEKDNWAYHSEPEVGLMGARSYQPRGKRLGGTGSINGMVYMRGRPEDYNYWRELGCDGWGYEDVLPYFRKSEDNKRGPSMYHGVGGPISVEDGPRNELGDAFLAAASDAGYPLTADHALEHEGFGYAQLTGKNGRRSSSATGFLPAALKRPNFTLIPRALVKRILFHDRRATGIEYIQDGLTRVLHARRETVISAGAFNSPKLLQLSGVGPATLLDRHKIPIVADRPGVGQNLQDHFAVSMVYRCPKPITIAAVMANPIRLAGAGLQYFLFRKGLLATNGNICMGYFRGGSRGNAADSAVALVNWARVSVGGEARGLGLFKFSSFTLTVSILQPKSRGSVCIRSADPALAPEIRFNFFQSEEDQDVLSGAIQKVRGIMSARPMAPYATAELAPGSQFRSRDELIEYCRRFGRSTHHGAGTCKMGAGHLAVVDPRLRVIGVSNLRVIDASVMPHMICGNINAPTVMIAEKGAALTLEDNDATP